VTGKPDQHQHAESVADSIIERLGGRIALALPLGLGKANLVANAGLSLRPWPKAKPMRRSVRPSRGCSWQPPQVCANVSMQNCFSGRSSKENNLLGLGNPAYRADR
jgi:hypothetical protein